MIIIILYDHLIPDSKHMNLFTYLRSIIQISICYNLIERNFLYLVSIQLDASNNNLINNNYIHGK
jgi:hypothetical protein